MQRWIARAALLAIAGVLPCVAAAASGDGGEALILPVGGSWTIASDMRADPLPTTLASVEIRGVGTFTYDPAEVRTTRPELFTAGRFSAFDVLAHLADADKIDLEYAFDEVQATHVVRSINGLEGWWYDVRMPGGAYERTALRMDTHPVKDGSTIYLYLEEPARLAALAASFREEVALLAAHGGRVVIPVVTIKGPRTTTTFENVAVTAHNSRPDVFQPGVITVLDVLLSLGEQGRIIGLDLAWHAAVGGTPNVNHYMVDWISLPDALGQKESSCGFMDAAATEGLRAFLTPHSHATTEIHMSPDLEVLVSPGYVEWEWLCATS